jgi:hypothetical protein
LSAIIPFLLICELLPAIHVTASGTACGVKAMRKLMMFIFGLLAYRRLVKQSRKSDPSTAMG